VNSPSSHSPRTVALVGNPNCGKTTLFNALTGSRYKVANYPGVTVETKEGSLALPDGSVVRILDLPGTYALEGSSIDEKLVSQVLTGKSGSSERPDLIIAVVDATNLQRNLFLVSELIDANYRIILAINMIDEAERAGIKIYDELLARALDVTVVTMSARSHRGLDTLCEAVASELRRETRSSKKCAWLSIEHQPKEMLTSGSFDARTLEAFREDPLNALASASPDTIARVGGLRYSWLRKIVERSTSSSLPSLGKGLSRLDRFLTSKAWGLPILLALFGLIFQAIFLWAQAPMELISTLVESVSAAISASLPPGMLTRLLAEGIVPGVGNVVVFVPQIAILFMCFGHPRYSCNSYYTITCR